MKKIVAFLVVCLSFFFSLPVFASDVEYSIPLYQGHLTIHKDNTADFTQEVTYRFSTSYNGQYVSLGRAGDMPEGFAIDANPKVTAYRNGTPVDISSQLEDIGDGYRLKVYNSGYDGDEVKLVVNWKLENIVSKYQDIAVLNWKPISDWDVPLKEVVFKVDTEKSSEKSQLAIHRGYFKENTLNNSGNTYETKSYDVTGPVEFHAYWDKDIVDGPSISQNYLSTFSKTEANIAKYTKWTKLFFFAGIYILMALLIGLAFLLWRLFKNSATAFESKTKDQLYALPGDMPPLVVSELVYNLNLEKLNPLKAGALKEEVTFDNLLQATLLDLIDRKILTLKTDAEVPRIQVANPSQLTSFEKDFVSMAFGSEVEKPMDQLFSDYFFDEDLSSKLRNVYSGIQLEQEVNRQGRQQLQKLDHMFEKITDSVKMASDSEGQNHYRDLSNGERSKVYLSLFILFIAMALLVISGFYMMLQMQIKTVFAYIAIFVLIIVLIVKILKDYQGFSVQGVLTQEGQESRQVWDSFRRMLADINHFERAEIESLIIWNRVLVYATLFGFADKVENYMRLHDINLSNTELGRSYGYVHPYMYGITNAITTSGMAASQASNFSVSSGSGSSGGFSSGGFSGGGGGGGGGAF